MGKVVVGAVQVAPVFLDREATVEKACQLIEKAAAHGVDLVAFPEAFVPAYPDWVWRSRPWDDGVAEWSARLIDQSVVVPGPSTERIGQQAYDAGVYVSIGVNERDPVGGTLYNTQLYFGPDGALLGKHRKLVPTGAERLIWGQGDGSTLLVLDTPIGKLGGLTCWENYMPLARAALYAQGIEIWLAPTWDNSDVWVPTLRHIAKEGRVFVVGVNFCLEGSDIPQSIPGRDDLYGGDGDWLSRGNSVIIGPEGEILAGPLVEEEGILVAELDVERARVARRQFDAVGHYSRPDVFRLVVDSRPKAPVVFEDFPAYEIIAPGPVPGSLVEPEPDPEPDLEPEAEIERRPQLQQEPQPDLEPEGEPGPPVETGEIRTEPRLDVSGGFQVPTPVEGNAPEGDDHDSEGFKP